MIRLLATTAILVIALSGCGQGQPADAESKPAHEPSAWMANHVEPGDILVSIDGTPVKSREEAMRVFSAVDPSAATVEVVIDRKGRIITLHIDRASP